MMNRCDRCGKELAPSDVTEVFHGYEDRSLFLCDFCHDRDLAARVLRLDRCGRSGWPIKGWLPLNAIGRTVDDVPLMPSEDCADCRHVVEARDDCQYDDRRNTAAKTVEIHEVCGAEVATLCLGHAMIRAEFYASNDDNGSLPEFLARIVAEILTKVAERLIER
jgi:hypothetical protein